MVTAPQTWRAGRSDQLLLELWQQKANVNFHSHEIFVNPELPPQVTLRPALYPTDVLNILTETGGLTVAGMAALSDGRVAWSLTK